MPDYKSRKIKFKAWNTATNLLMRLNSIECSRGELIKKDHILLQFTGLLDKEGEEIYDQDILLIYSEKFLVFWDEDRNGWFYEPMEQQKNAEPFVAQAAEKMKRFCSKFELK